MRVSGLDDVFLTLSRTGAEVEKRFASALDKFGKKLAAEGAKLAPKGETLRLSTSIESTPVGKTAREVGPTVEYGRYVEYGTATRAPDPFMGPAMDKIEPAFIKELDGIVEKSL